MKVLFCTVGGSHQPIITAIKQVKPEFIYFICSETDPVTNRAGSSIQINGKGKCIKAGFNDPSPTLENIPAQLGLSVDQYEIFEVPSDFLNEIVEKLNRLFTQANDRFADADFIADFTGGTKSMTAGLAVAALDHGDVQLQIITAPRTDLIKVTKQSYSQQLDMSDISFKRMLVQQLKSLEYYAYAEVFDGIQKLDRPQSRESLTYFHKTSSLCKGFDLWDKFNHKEAFDNLSEFMSSFAVQLSPYINTLRLLASESSKDSNKIAKQDLIKIFDLWLNAERKIKQNRYDDAVARMYRLIEWAAQWLLKSFYQLDAAKFKWESLPPDLQHSYSAEMDIKIGLIDCWRVLGYLADNNSTIKDFAEAQINTILNLTKSRNQSILAHGYMPISQKDVDSMQDWIKNHLIPFLLEVGKSFKVDAVPFQLPSNLDFVMS